MKAMKKSLGNFPMPCVKHVPCVRAAEELCGVLAAVGVGYGIRAAALVGLVAPDVVFVNGGNAKCIGDYDIASKLVSFMGRSRKVDSCV